MDILERYRRAERRLGDGDPAGAVEDLRIVCDAEPGSTGAQLMLARAYFHTAQLGRAADTYAELVALEPANPEALVGLARSLERLGRYVEALPPARLAAAVHPDAQYAEIAERIARSAAAHPLPPPHEPPASQRG